MPRGDRTGPRGQGPRTGKGRGNCNSKDRVSVPMGRGGNRSGRKANRSHGQRFGQGSGQGTGRGAGQGQGRQS